MESEVAVSNFQGSKNHTRDMETLQRDWDETQTPRQKLTRGTLERWWLRSGNEKNHGGNLSRAGKKP